MYIGPPTPPTFAQDPPRVTLAVGTRSRDLFRSPLLAEHRPLIFVEMSVRRIRRMGVGSALSMAYANMNDLWPIVGPYGPK